MQDGTGPGMRVLQIRTAIAFQADGFGRVVDCVAADTVLQKGVFDRAQLRIRAFRMLKRQVGLVRGLQDVVGTQDVALAAAHLLAAGQFNLAVRVMRGGFYQLRREPAHAEHDHSQVVLLRDVGDDERPVRLKVLVLVIYQPDVLGGIGWQTLAADEHLHEQTVRLAIEHYGPVGFLVNLAGVLSHGLHAQFGYGAFRVILVERHHAQSFVQRVEAVVAPLAAGPIYLGESAVDLSLPRAGHKRAG